MSLKKYYIAMVLCFWPLTLYLSNTLSDYFIYVLPSIFLVLAYFTWNRFPLISYGTILSIALVTPKLVLFPALYFLLSLFLEKGRWKVLFLVLSLFLIFFQRSAFIGQSVFQPDYEAQQQVLRDSQLYDSIFIARMFHNKARIPLEKIAHTFFTLTDPNNYFFAFHPREDRDNQTLQKFPFLSIFFFLFGLNILKEWKQHRFIIIAFVSGIISLCILTNFDRNDFILWLPVSLIILHGISNLKGKPFFTYSIYLCSILFAVIELIRIITLR